MTRAYAWPLSALTFISIGLILRIAGRADLAQSTWLAGLVITGAPVAWRTLRQAFQGTFATDLVAALAVVTAVLLGQPLAGLIVVLMQTGGEALEAYAAGRASQALKELEADLPAIAHRVTDAGTADVTVQSIVPGDLLLIRPGERVPCDGEVLEGHSAVDTSRITGEPMPRSATPGAHVPSGSINGNAPFTMRATATADESQYARIVHLVREAQASKAPLQRLADRYAIWFTPLTLAVCAIAWFLARDPTRVLAVLVVATPCPLILATPIAMIGGINRGARRHVIFRSGAALERLATVNTGIFDKTGTLTIGRPTVADIEVDPAWTSDEVLRRAAAVERGSGHLLARSVVDEAVRRRLSIPEASEVREWPGQGITGTVAGHEVAVGGWSFMTEHRPAALPDLKRLLASSQGLRAIVAIDGRGAGVIHYADELRPGLPTFFHDLHRLGVRRLALLSGDTGANAEAVARAVGIDEVHGDLLPGDKVAFVRACLAQGERVLMVGDGTNDAPALAAATVGVALAAHGGGVSAESADVVLLVDDPTRLVEAIGISRDTMRIAHQSIQVGLALSGLAMLFAAAGHIVPVVGALLQEVIDIGVILNALRAGRRL